jgi:hypothetical protein
VGIESFSAGDELGSGIGIGVANDALYGVRIVGRCLSDLL